MITPTIALLATFGAFIFWGLGDFLIQRSVRKLGDLKPLSYIGAFGTLALLPFIIQDLLHINKTNLYLLLGLGILGFIVSWINFETLRKGKISVVDVIFEMELPVTIILGFIFLDETLTTPQLSAILVIFLGLILVATKKLNIKNKKSIERGVLLAFITAIGLGFINFLTGIAAQEASPLLAIWFPWMIIFFVIIIIEIKNNGWNSYIQGIKKYPTLIISTSVIDTLAWVCFAYAVTQQQIGITVAVTEGYPIIGIILGRIINKEHLHTHQYIGAALTLAAAITLATLI
ncbi:MAG TPA: DMT family transporter [Candidatus Nanoarchaeia archaeon]|nr:DMT family transporter [Candidatus Nanoarchaeia archaeon]